MNDILKRQAELREKKAADTFFDSLISELPTHQDAKQSEKGPIFRSARPLVYAAIAIFLALVFAVALSGCGGGGDEEVEDRIPPVNCAAFPRPKACI